MQFSVPQFISVFNYYFFNLIPFFLLPSGTFLPTNFMGGFRGLKRCSFCDYSHKLSAQVRRHERQSHGENALQCTVSGCEQRVSYNRLARHIRQCHSDALKAIDTSSTLDGQPLTEEAQTDELVVLEQKQRRMEQREKGETDEQSKEGDAEGAPTANGGGEGNVPGDVVVSDASASQLATTSPPSVGVVPTAQLALGQHECTKCGQRKATREALRRHIARVHDKRYREPKREKGHHCEWEGCGKSFTTRGRLEDHVNAHTGNCPFSCDHCKRNFVARAQFLRHLRKYHAVSVRQMGRHIEQMVDLSSE